MKKLKRWQYKDYMASPEWTATKERFKKTKNYRDGFCFICVNWSVEIHIHHKTYARLGCEKMGDLRTLCAVCHAVTHELGDFKRHKRNWHKHASRERLWGLRYRDPKRYAYEVAKFFGVLDHPFVRRVL